MVLLPQEKAEHSAPGTEAVTAPAIDPRRHELFPPDEVLVPAIVGGESALFEVVMRRHNRRLFRVAMGVLSDPDEAEDVLQETYVAAWRGLSRFEFRSSLSTWLVRIALHEALERRRRRKAVNMTSIEERVGNGDVGPRRLSPLRDRELDPERRAANTELRQLMEAALDSLEERQRLVFLLRTVEHLSTAETARCLGLSKSHVKVLLFRARRALRARLERKLGSAATEVYGFHLDRCDRVVSAVWSRIQA